MHTTRFRTAIQGLGFLSLASALLLAAAPLAAQAADTPAAKPAATHKSAKPAAATPKSAKPAAKSSTTPKSAAQSSRSRKRAAKSAAAPAAAEPAAVLPVAAEPKPELPDWPANEHASPARVTWDAAGLRVEAQNSSLAQILVDISTATGSKVEGFSSDQRVFGVYGPGKARDVLSQLLAGAGYNVLMYGDLGLGAPRQIVLASRVKSGDGQPGAQDGQPSADAGVDSDDEEEVVEEQPEPTPAPARPGFGPGGQPRTPQQIMQDMQQRQQEQQPTTQPQ